MRFCHRPDGTLDIDSGGGISDGWCGRDPCARPLAMKSNNEDLAWWRRMQLGRGTMHPV